MAFLSTFGLGATTALACILFCISFIFLTSSSTLANLSRKLILRTALCLISSMYSTLFFFFNRNASSSPFAPTITKSMMTRRVSSRSFFCAASVLVAASSLTVSSLTAFSLTEESLTDGNSSSEVSSSVDVRPPRNCLNVGGYSMSMLAMSSITSSSTNDSGSRSVTSVIAEATVSEGNSVTALAILSSFPPILDDTKSFSSPASPDSPSVSRRDSINR
mmetsp:Transcript_11003/g.17780  ORF Transcript_11003/g.17780 Transcript_11003/m.17780 type:complete len:219 (-) Transcript_11003:369-1025(-)